MDISSLLTNPHPMLRRVSQPVGEFTVELAELALEMRSVMRALGGVGLAAPQVGLSLRMFVLESGKVSLSVVNPVILTASGSRPVSEGCLSIPGMRYLPERPTLISASWQDLEGCQQSGEFTGLLAQIWCHEVDHLDGVLVLERCDPSAVRSA